MTKAIELKLSKEEIVIELTNFIMQNNILHVRMLNIEREMNNLRKDFNDLREIESKIYKEIMKYL